MNKHLFLYPELLSRLLFTQTLEGKYLVRASLAQQPRIANPEEIIRQIFILALIQHYGYPEDRIKLEQVIMMGRERKRADIVVSGDTGKVDIIVEVKQDIDSDTIAQLRSYLMATGASVGAAVSGHEIRSFVRNGNQLSEIYDLPIYGEAPGNPIVEKRMGHESETILLDAGSSDLIQAFERVSLNRTKITIKGHTLEFANKDLTELRKVRARFINDGIALGTNLERSDWLMLIESLFSQATEQKNVLSDYQNIELNNDLNADNLNQDRVIVPGSKFKNERSLINPIEVFERINRANVKITIQGIAHVFSNQDVVELKKVKRRFITDGVAIGGDFSNSDWMDIIAMHFGSAPIPSKESLVISPESLSSCLAFLLKQELNNPLNIKLSKSNIQDLLKNTQYDNSNRNDILILLNDVGINVKGDRVYIANNHPLLYSLFANSRWSKGWAKDLKAINQAESTKALRFGSGVISRATSIPIATCLLEGYANKVLPE
jgi:hypothetical protein